MKRGLKYRAATPQAPFHDREGTFPDEEGTEMILRGRTAASSRRCEGTFPDEEGTEMAK